MTRLTPIASLRVPLGGQQIDLQQVDYEAGGMSPLGRPEGEYRSAQHEGVPMSLLRTRIREGSRFTVFDVDPLTAGEWGRALVRWADAQSPE